MKSPSARSGEKRESRAASLPLVPGPRPPLLLNIIASLDRVAVTAAGVAAEAEVAAAR
jgi:hypothetical protein